MFFFLAICFRHFCPPRRVKSHFTVHNTTKIAFTYNSNTILLQTKFSVVKVTGPRSVPWLLPFFMCVCCPRRFLRISLKKIRAVFFVFDVSPCTYYLSFSRFSSNFKILNYMADCSQRIFAKVKTFTRR